MPYLHVGDMALYYERTGTGQPLLLIHGLGASTRDWAYQVAYFARHYQVITVDLRGHGQSAKPAGPYSIPQFAADTATLLISLGSGPAVVVGHSLGGMIAFELAVRAPTLVRRLVIVNSAPEIPARTVKERLAILLGYCERHVIVHLFGMRTMGDILSRRLFPNPEQAALRHAFMERYATNQPRAYLAAMHAMRGWSATARLASIACPTLVVAAEDDYTSLASKATYVAQIPQATLITVPHSRHFTPLDQPHAFNVTLEQFLAHEARAPQEDLING